MSKFNYAKHVVPPGDIANMRNIFSIVFNVRDSFDYGKSSLIGGFDCKGKNLVLGDRFFMKSGYCDDKKSVPQCRGKSRYIYFDNVPQGVYPCIDKSQPVSSRCLTNQNAGLIPGLLQDVVQVNPFELIYSSVGDGSVVNDTCVLRTELVGTQSGDSSNFMEETRCAPERAPLVCGLRESFTNISDDSHADQSAANKNKASSRYLALIAIVLFMLLLILFLCLR